MNDFNESKPVEAQDSYLDSLPNEMKEEAKKKFNMICFGCTFSGEDRASFKERGICLCGKRFVLPLSNCILGTWKCSAETWGSPSANFVEWCRGIVCVRMKMCTSACHKVSQNGHSHTTNHSPLLQQCPFALPRILSQTVHQILECACVFHNLCKSFQHLF